MSLPDLRPDMLPFNLRLDLPVLHVLVVPDGPTYFAQGLEIDYFAGGDTPQQTIKFFLKGLKDIAEAHIETTCGHIRQLVKPPSDETWREFMGRLHFPEAYSVLRPFELKLWTAIRTFSVVFFVVKETS